MGVGQGGKHRVAAGRDGRIRHRLQDGRDIMFYSPSAHISDFHTDVRTSQVLTIITDPSGPRTIGAADKKSLNGFW